MTRTAGMGEEVKSGEGFSSWGLSGWGEELRGADGEGGWVGDDANVTA